MALNVTVAGFVRDEAAAVIGSAYVQMWFRKVNGASSASAWKPVQQADVAGYFSANLGDGDWLTQDGAAAAGDQVLIAVWTGEATRLGTTKSRFSFRVITLDGSSVYNQDVVCYDDDAPNTTMNGAATTPRLTNYTLTNTSNDAHTFANDTYQQPAWQGETIFDAAGLATVAVDWGDGDPVDTLIGTANGTHQYDDAPGTALTITSTARDVRGNDDATPDTDAVTILARTPDATITVDDSTPDIGDTITFSLTGISDPDSRITSVDWSFDGGSTWPVAAVATSYEPQVLCATTTDFQAQVRVNWNDGVSTLATVVDTQNITVYPVAGFTAASENTAAAKYTWTDTSAGTISNYAWDLDYNPGAGYQDEASGSGAGMDTFTYSFSVEGNYRMRLTVTDADGESDVYESEFSVNIVAGAGGAGSRAVLTPLGTKGVIT